MGKYASYREFYETKLLPDLIALDGERKQVDRRVLLTAGLSIGLMLIIFTLIPGEYRVILAVLVGIVAISVIFMANTKYSHNFKTKIIAKIAGYVDESLIYTPGGSISKTEFDHSAIFLQSCNTYSGEDHFQGKIGKTAIEFSEILARQKTTSGTGSKRREHYTTIFKGVFFVADFNKDFNTRTVVLPDTAEKLFGKFGQKMQSLSFGRGELVKLEDPEFEREFCVYGDDQIEARYILSTSLMRRILQFKQKWNSNIYLSFIDSKVYIAISLNKDLFETRLFKSIVDYDFIEENMKYLILLTGIVEELNLNTRIWSKR